jgi:hypothetical protein
LGENTQKVSVQELKLPKLEETKRLTVVNLWDSGVDRSSTSGENTLRESECAEVETPEALIIKVNHSRPIQKETRQKSVDSG